MAKPAGNRVKSRNSQVLPLRRWFGEPHSVSLLLHLLSLGDKKAGAMERTGFVR
jgi:hypothetical protein